MAKRIPIDCKRIKPHHLERLSADELEQLFLRIEVQSQQLNRTRRLVYQAIDRVRGG